MTSTTGTPKFSASVSSDFYVSVCVTTECGDICKATSLVQNQPSTGKLQQVLVIENKSTPTQDTRQQLHRGKESLPTALHVILSLQMASSALHAKSPNIEEVKRKGRQEGLEHWLVCLQLVES